jgi:hypothetical protein
MPSRHDRLSVSTYPDGPAGAGQRSDTATLSQPKSGRYRAIHDDLATADKKYGTPVPAVLYLRIRAFAVSLVDEGEMGGFSIRGAAAGQVECRSGGEGDLV